MLGYGNVKDREGKGREGERREGGVGVSTNLASQRINAEHIAVCGTVQLAARGEELEVYHSMSAAQQLLSPYVSYSCAVVSLLAIISLTSRIPPAPSSFTLNHLYTSLTNLQSTDLPISAHKYEVGHACSPLVLLQWWLTYSRLSICSLCMNSLFKGTLFMHGLIYD